MFAILASVKIIVIFCFINGIYSEHLELMLELKTIILNYFQMYNIGCITVMCCWSKFDKSMMMKESSERGLKISYSFDSMETWPSIRHGGVLDLNCPQTEHHLKQIRNEKMFGIHTEWILIDVIRNFTLNPSGEIIASDGILLASDSYALPGSCVRVVQIIPDSAMAYYYNMYRISMREPMKFLLEWAAPIGQLPTHLIQCSYLNRSNFDGATLTAAIVIEFPDLFKGFDSMYHMDVDIWPKTHYPITMLFAEQLNFKINFTVTRSFGWLVDNDTYFDGMIGMLQREEVEIGATGAFMRHDRMDAAQFCAETYDPRTAVLFKQPPLSSAYNIFLLPFTRWVWIACLLLSLLVTGVLTLEYFTYKYRTSYPYEQKNIKIIDLVTMVLSTACQQGTELMPVSIPARITVFIFSLSAFFLYTSYSANIVALLQSKAPVLKSLNDITSSHLGFKVQDLRYNRKFFKEASDDKITNLYKKKVEPFGDHAYCLPEEGIRLVRSGKFAFSVEANVGYKIISRTFEEAEKCVLDEMKMFFNPKLGIPVVKRSGHREHITRKMAWQREVGLQEKIALYWLPHKPNCEGHASKGFISVGIKEFLPALLVFFYGLAITLGIFIMETVYYYSWRIYEKRKIHLLQNTRLLYVK